MKRFILYVLVVLVCIVTVQLVCDCVINWLIHHSTGNPIYKMERLWCESHQNEIPILGSSRAQANFIPSIISTNCFNYGCDGMGMAETLFNLRAIQERHSTYPVILNFDPWATFSRQPKSWRGDYRLAPKSGRASFIDRVWGMRFYGMLRVSLSSYLNNQQSITKVVDSGAVILKTSRTAEEWQIINSQIEPCCFSYYDEECGVGLSDSIRALAPRKVIVVVCPCSSRWTAVYNSKDLLANFLQQLSKIPNVQIINLFASTEFVDSDFVDPTHLNICGAQKLSRILRERISMQQLPVKLTGASHDKEHGDRFL